MPFLPSSTVLWRVMELLLPGSSEIHSNRKLVGIRRESTAQNGQVLSIGFGPGNSLFFYAARLLRIHAVCAFIARFSIVWGLYRGA